MNIAEAVSSTKSSILCIKPQFTRHALDILFALQSPGSIQLKKMHSAFSSQRGFFALIRAERSVRCHQLMKKF
jgi:hypothetical protein